MSHAPDWFDWAPSPWPQARRREPPANQAMVQPLINDLGRQISTATSGPAATVLAFTPAQWDANSSLLRASTSSEQTADGALQTARADVKQIVQALKGSGDAGLHGHAAPPTTTTTG
jgi:hypothetical protein